MIWVTCRYCGCRQALERVVVEPMVITLICHGCETTLEAVVTWEHVQALRRLVPATARST